MYQPTALELELSEVSREIGSICDKNCHWMAGLERLVRESDKPLDDLTVGELCRLIAQRTETYNRLYEGCR